MDGEDAGQERLVLAEAARPSVGGGVLTALSGLHSIDRTLVWVDRAGNRLGTFGRQIAYVNSGFSRTRRGGAPPSAGASQKTLSCAVK